MESKSSDSIGNRDATFIAQYVLHDVLRNVNLYIKKTQNRVKETQELGTSTIQLMHMRLDNRFKDRTLNRVTNNMEH